MHRLAFGHDASAFYASASLGTPSISAHSDQRHDCCPDMLRYQPIQICIQNETRSYLLLSPQSLNVPLAPPEDVARYVHTNTVGRALIYGVPGIIIWPLLVPAVADGVGSSQANQKLDADYSSKGINETVIQPYTTLNRIIFVPKSEFNGAFRLTLLDKETRDKLIYEVRLSAGG